MVIGVRRQTSAKTPVVLILVLMLLICSAAIAYTTHFPQLTDDGLRKKNGTVVDVGNASQGYIHVKHKAGGKRLKVRISRGEQTYTYDLNQDGNFEIFPLQMGSGSYKVKVFEQVRGSKYSSVSTISFDAQIQDSMLPYLYPNQYVSYDADSPLVAKAQELCAGIESDAEKANRINSYVAGRFMYDYMKALTVNNMTTYLPDLDAVFESKKGICFDFAAMVCAMLRAQGIPTQLIVGYADAKYHAWNQAYIGGEWVMIDTTANVTGVPVKRYQPERQY